MPTRRDRSARRTAIAIFKAIGLLAWLGLLLPLQALVLLLTRGAYAFVLPPLIHRGICAILGIHLQTQGAPVRGAPVRGAPVQGVGVRARNVVWIGNHLSYLDIPLLGSILRAAFVAKDDVRQWPLLGWMTRLQQTVFVSRERRRVVDAKRLVNAALTKGHALILFPEGTSSDGRQVLPFRPSLLPHAPRGPGPEVVLQPVAIELLSTDGMSASRQDARDRYAYYADMQLAGHLWEFMRGAGAELRVSFLEPVLPAPGESRRHLAERIQLVISDVIGPGSLDGVER